MRLASTLTLAALAATPLAAQSRPATPTRPFGTMREQAQVQQQWLAKRMDTFLPALMRKYRVDMWVIPMREYNEDPVFSAITSPTTMAARRRTIYVFYDRCAAGGMEPAPDCTKGIERLALGGTSQGGVYTAVSSMKAVTAAVGGRQAELWGDEQWEALKKVIVERNPRVIAINTSKVFAFTDGLSSGELAGMSDALGPAWSQKFRPAEGLALEMIASRLPEETAYYRKHQELVWSLIARMFSNEVITPGKTHTSELVWWWRQQVADLGIGTWFQPSIEIQRMGTTSDKLGDDPVIMPGDVLHCDVGITALRLNTDTQHDAYVLKDGETAAPAGLTAALRNGNRLQDLLMEETRPGRTGNEILAAVRARMLAEKIDGTVYTHPIGLHGHGAGPLIGLWDYQDGVPGRGDAPVTANMWFSSELQATTPVPEWGGQPVRMAQEEDFVIGPDGKPQWAYRRQSELWLVKPKGKDKPKM
ncbi:MAG: aminopeptidase P family protein [Gemmatimonadetes bacterium]|nr:aminopeptidase P family protein [Gemmatimonadota bacterium]